jgi:hypothetical protein
MKVEATLAPSSHLDGTDGGHRGKTGRKRPMITFELLKDTGVLV